MHNSLRAAVALFLVSPPLIKAELEALPKLPAIAEVASMADLDAVLPDTRFGGWELRLAMAPAAMPDVPVKGGAAPDFSPYPWRILYADFRRTKAGAELPEDGIRREAEPLGPLAYTLDFEPGEGVLRREVLRDDFEMAKQLSRDSDHYLFASTVLTPEKGTYHIRIFPTSSKRDALPEDNEEEAIAESIWKQDDPAKFVWAQFAHSQIVPLPDLAIPVPDQMATPFVPAAPDFDGFQSLLPPEKIEPEKGAPADPRPIPAMIPATTDPGFKIAPSGAGIAINLEKPKSRDIEYFLARWWIDGNPVTLTFDEFPARKEFAEELREHEKIDESTFTTRIPFDLPDALKAAKPDSKLALQLLYSPTGTKEIDRDGMGLMKEIVSDIGGATVLRLSNKLEFRLSDLTP